MTTDSAHRRGGAKCFLENNGKINCSNIIYEDESSWRKSRLQIDMMIKVLKNKIVNLKDIKKHLKDHRPHTVGEYEDSIEEDTVETSETPSTRKPHFHHHHRHHQQHLNHHNNSEFVERRRKVGNHSSEVISQLRLSSSIIKSDKNELPLIDNQINLQVLPVNVSLFNQSTSSRRMNRTHSLNQRRKSNYEEMAAFRAEHQAMFSTTKLPILNTLSTSADVDVPSKVKPNRSKTTRKPNPSETTATDLFSTTTETASHVVAISNELSSNFYIHTQTWLA